MLPGVAGLLGVVAVVDKDSVVYVATQTSATTNAAAARVVDTGVRGGFAFTFCPRFGVVCERGFRIMFKNCVVSSVVVRVVM